MTKDARLREFQIVADELDAYLLACAKEGLIFRNAKEASRCYCIERVFPVVVGRLWSLFPDEHLEPYKQAFERAFDALLDKDCWRLARAFTHDKEQRASILGCVAQQILKSA